MAWREAVKGIVCGKAIRNTCRGSGRLPVVVVKQAAEPVAASHRSVPRGRRERDRAVLLEALGRPGVVVERDVLRQHAPQGLSWPRSLSMRALPPSGASCPCSS